MGDRAPTRSRTPWPSTTAGDLFIASGPATGSRSCRRGAASPSGSVSPSACRSRWPAPARPGFGGDGGPADRSELDDPTGVAVDAQGDLLVGRHRQLPAPHGGRVRRHRASAWRWWRATSRRWPATDHLWIGGDGGPARQAELWDPGALAVDAAGDVFVADQGNRTIRVLASHSASFFGVATVRRSTGHGGRRGILRAVPGRRARRHRPGRRRPTSRPGWPSTPTGTSSSPTAPCTPSGSCRPPTPVCWAGRSWRATCIWPPARVSVGLFDDQHGVGPDPDGGSGRTGGVDRRGTDLRRQRGRRGPSPAGLTGR